MHVLNKWLLPCDYFNPYIIMTNIGKYYKTVTSLYTIS